MKKQRKNLSLLTDQEFERFTLEVTAPSRSPGKPGLYLNFPFDLRSSFDEKVNTAAAGTTWTAFVNNAGTLVHVLCPEADILVRLVFRYPLASLNSQRMKQVIIARLERWVKL